MDQAYRLAKEQHVTGHDGTTKFEILQVALLLPVREINLGVLLGLEMVPSPPKPFQSVCFRFHYFGDALFNLSLFSRGFFPVCRRV